MFTKDTFDFLFENRLLNSREWFKENKTRYEEGVLKPLAELATELGGTIASIDGEIITEPKVDKTISRIYRDTRFSKDKSIYREEMWLSFRRDKKAFPNYPEFFFVVMPGEFIYGCGYYAATAEAMNSVRQLITEDNELYLKAKKVFDKSKDMVIEGDKYKKTRHPAEPPEKQEWLDRKSLCFMYRSRDFSLLCSEELPAVIKASFKEMAPMYKLCLYAEERKGFANS